MASSYLEQEVNRYRAGQYTVEWVENFIPYGPSSLTATYKCHGCKDEKVCTYWVSHSVHQGGSDYQQNSMYCEECAKTIDPLVKELHAASAKIATSRHRESKCFCIC